MRFVFISEGDLFLKNDGAEPVEIESPFAREAIERASARSNRNAWKGQGREEMGVYSAGVVWGRQAGGQRGQDHPVIRSVVRGPADNELLYALAMSASSGLFRYNLETKDELRLFHRQDFDGCGLSCHRPTAQVVISSRNEDKLGKLELYEEATRRRQRLTDGEGHDSNPAQDPNAPHLVYFQSSGVARNEQGVIVAFGPAAIHRLDTTTGTMESIAEDPRWDYLQPKVDAAGNLHYIRRPHGDRDDLPFLQKLKAFFLIPFHLAAGIFGFLEAFTRMFGKRSLRPAGTGKDLPMERSRYATFHDTTVALEKVLDKRGQIDESQHLVPATWELIRRDKSGTETVLASHVVAYDLGPNGELLYSDGLRVWQGGSSPKKLFQGKVVQAVVMV
jgi:hypothetical protein